MKELSLKEARKIQLEMLSDFHEFCLENDLRYFLDAGTLLGAVRHNGFIPWDNDVDVAMPRSDYNKFFTLARDGYCNSVLLLPQESIYTYLKIADKRTILIEDFGSYKNEIGVYIDVYPKDGIREINLLSKLRCEIVKLLGLKHWFNKVTVHKWKRKGNAIQKILAIFSFLYTDKNRELNWLLALSEKYPFDKSKYVATIVSGGLKNCVSKEHLDKYILHQFEDLLLQIPKGFDGYLKRLYGDYMTLPPKEERKPHHNYIAYRIDD